MAAWWNDSGSTDHVWYQPPAFELTDSSFAVLGRNLGDTGGHGLGGNTDRLEPAAGSMLPYSVIVRGVRG